MACVMQGWKRPPWGECFDRWQGRTWPWVKKEEKSLGQRVSEIQGGILGRGEQTGS